MKLDLANLYSVYFGYSIDRINIRALTAKVHQLYNTSIVDECFMTQQSIAAKLKLELLNEQQPLVRAITLAYRDALNYMIYSARG